MEYVQSLLQTQLGLTLTAAVASAGIIALYLLGRGGSAIKGDVALDNQSYEIEPGVRVSHKARDGKLVSYYYDDAQTTHEAFKRGIKVSKNGPCLGNPTGPNHSYTWINYQEVYDRAHQFGSAMVSHNQQPGDSTFVGIYAANSNEWVIAEQACYMYSMVVVPLYDTLGADACSYVMNQTEMSVVVVDKVDKALALVKNADRTPSVQLVVVIQPITDELSAAAADQSLTVVSFADMEATGKSKMVPEVPPKPDDVCTICYTSGTTGNPKGVLLTHKNLIANTAAILVHCPHLKVISEDVHMSYLPLAHMFEAVVQLMMFQHGARVGFSRGDVRYLTDDLQILRPTIFPTVPRLLNRIYDKVMAGAKSSRIKSFIFNLALSRKMALLRQGVITKNSVWDKLVFGKVQKLLGGRVRFVVTGSAPLSGSVLNFTRCAFGCTIFEGYGQTEATAAVTFTLENEYQQGHVGCPLVCNMVKLVDVPEMEYWAKDNRGEVCVKGTNLMKGYYKEPQKTADTIDADGWLHTGDVGQWLDNGTLKIIDRAKHLFKLAQGEYLAPEKIEGVYLRSPIIAQAFVDGSSLETYAVGIFVPDPDVFPGWAKKQGFSGSYTDLCTNPRVKEAVLADITKHAKDNGLKGFEAVKQLHLECEMFSVENGLLTPTFKSKRPALRKFYNQNIHQMYNKN